MILNLVDFDGTLVYNDEALYHAYGQAIIDLGLSDSTLEDIIEIQKEHYHTSMDKMYSALGLSFADHEEMVHRKAVEDYPHNYMAEIQINQPLVNLLMKVEGINAIVTHSEESDVWEILRYFGIDSLFTFVTDKNRGEKKPSPDLFRKAYNHTVKIFDRVSTVNIFEDSDWGLEAGKEFKETVFANTNIFKVV